MKQCNQNAYNAYSTILRFAKKVIIMINGNWQVPYTTTSSIAHQHECNVISLISVISHIDTAVVVKHPIVLPDFCKIIVSANQNGQQWHVYFRMKLSLAVENFSSYYDAVSNSSNELKSCCVCWFLSQA